MTSSELKDAERPPDTATETAPESAPAENSGRGTRRPLVWHRFRFGIQSKILVALLLAGILGVAVIGLIGALTGRGALREVESERLIELRESQKRQIEALFREVTNSLIVYSGGFSINEALTAFSAGFNQ